MKSLLRMLRARRLPAGGDPSAADSRFGGRREADRLIAEGNRAEKDGEWQRACQCYREAAHAAPDYAKAHLNLGIGLEALGESAAAFSAFERALALDPADPYASYNLARLCYLNGDHARAERLLRSALGRKPEFPEAWVVLFNVCESRGDYSAALAAIETALRQREDYAGAWYDYGYVLFRLGQTEQAEAAFRRAMELDPDFLSAYHMLAHMLRGEARVAEALETFDAARKLAPERFDLESMILHALTLHDGASAAEIAHKHREFGARLEARYPARFAPFVGRAEPARRLRIGYVSSDFSLHPVAWFVIPVLERHDRAAFEVFCYSTAANADEVTAQVRARADVWRDCHALSEEEMADAIHRDRIDILVDLTGHAGLMRLGVFAQQPAPVQVSWLGYLNTTGLRRIHYRLCDAWTDPPGLTEHLHTERLVRLPHSQWCYRPFLSIPHASELPLRKNGFVTFGSFNHIPKLSRSTRRLWIEILNRLPEARLLLAGVSEGKTREMLQRDFREAGIAESRIRTVPRIAYDHFLRLFDEVDIALDPTPYSGGTTTCDTLWMGVPVLTVPGERSASRSAASILATVGLTDWIAADAEDYVRRALRFASEPGLLAELRSTLRQRMRESPLMDEAGFVRDLERAYRDMWAAWCEHEAR